MQMPGGGGNVTVPAFSYSVFVFDEEGGVEGVEEKKKRDLPRKEGGPVLGMRV
jgi:hypothetical protein